MVTHQIPIERLKISGKPSDSFEKRQENLYNTLRFLWEKIRRPMVNQQTPIERLKISGKPADSYGKR